MISQSRFMIEVTYPVSVDHVDMAGQVTNISVLLPGRSHFMLLWGHRNPQKYPDLQQTVMPESKPVISPLPWTRLCAQTGDSPHKSLVQIIHAVKQDQESLSGDVNPTDFIADKNPDRTAATTGELCKTLRCSRAPLRVVG